MLSGGKVVVFDRFVEIFGKKFGSFFPTNFWGKRKEKKIRWPLSRATKKRIFGICRHCRLVVVLICYNTSQISNLAENFCKEK